MRLVQRMHKVIESDQASILWYLDKAFIMDMCGNCAF